MLNNINNLKSYLSNMAETPPEKTTLKQIVIALKPEILTLRSKGWKWKEIKNLLNDRGVKVSLATILLNVKEEV